MRILDRYILREFLRNLLLIALSFVALFLIIDFFEKIRMFLSNHATFAQMGSYFLFMLPKIVSQILPASLLLASLLTFGNLSRHSEITAMKASGISLYRAAVPVLGVAALASLFLFLLAELVAPPTHERAETIRLVEIQKKASLGSFKQDQIWYRGQKGIYNFRFFDTRTATLQGVTIHYLDRQMNLTMRLDAERGEWREGRWLFFNVLITRFDDGPFPLLTKQKAAPVDLPERPSDFQQIQKDVETMGYFELKRYIDKLQGEGYDATRYVVDLHGKAAFPLVGILLAIIGVAFSLRSERSGGIAQSIGAGLVIGFSYWLVHAFGISLGKAGTLPPFVAAWLANLLFASASLLLSLRVKS